jgi:hypothetical protein
MWDMTNTDLLEDSLQLLNLFRLQFLLDLLVIHAVGSQGYRLKRLLQLEEVLRDSLDQMTSDLENVVLGLRLLDNLAAQVDVMSKLGTMETGIPQFFDQEERNAGRRFLTPGTLQTTVWRGTHQRLTRNL